MYEEEGRFICPVCDYTPDSDEDAFLEYDHCPDCLSAIHEVDDDDMECGGTYEPIGMWVQGKGKWDVIMRCSLCGKLHTSPVTKKDNPLTVMNVASQPIANPPFPIDRAQELTDLMGGQGTMEGYYES